MAKKNICHFIPLDTDHGQLDTINFVLETTPQHIGALKTEALYKMHLVSAGTGALHTLGKVTPLEAGDIFFTFPAEAYGIESKSHFEYMYISFLGSRGNKLLDTLNVHRGNAVFHGHAGLKSFWQNAIEMTTPFSNLTSEGVLLFSFASLAQTESEQRSLQKGQAWAQIKKHLDDHFTDHDLNLQSLGNALGYNPKYISTVFKQHIGMGVSEYLNSLRIQHGCTLISQGFTSISDISTQSGFHDPQYFSKVFKQQMGLTPGQYIKQQK